MLQHRLGSQREAIQQGGDYSPRKSVAEKSSWWDKAKNFGSKLLKNPMVYGLANHAYDYARKKLPQFSGLINTAQKMHKGYVDKHNPPNSGGRGGGRGYGGGDYPSKRPRGPPPAYQSRGPPSSGLRSGQQAFRQQRTENSMVRRGY